MSVLLRKPFSMRQGQALFNFLEWLAWSKEFPHNQSRRMADPFFIEDEEFDKLWEEWLHS